MSLDSSVVAAALKLRFLIKRLLVLDKKVANLVFLGATDYF